MGMPKSAARYIGKLSNKLRRKIDLFTSKDDFSGAQGRVLHFILGQPEEVFQKDIEEEFGFRPSTATEILKKMESNELIHREISPYDARLKNIILTPKAMQYKKQVMEDLGNLERELVKNITPEELKIFFKVAEKMLNNLS